MHLNETYSKAYLGKHLSDTDPIRDGLQEGDAVSLLLFNFLQNMPFAGSKKPGGTKTEWATSAADLC
jgi:hypothetical protein